MSRPRVLCVFVTLLALPAFADSRTRIRLENTSSPGARVAITFAEPGRNPARLETSADGTAQLVVEAPSPRLRLRGGSLQTDPRIDLLARQQVRDSSPPPIRYAVNSHDTPASFAPASGPLVYDDWWGGSGWGYGCCSTPSYGGGWDIPVAREIPRERTRDRSPRSAPSGGTFSARGVMPRAGRSR